MKISSADENFIRGDWRASRPRPLAQRQNGFVTKRRELQKTLSRSPCNGNSDDDDTQSLSPQTTSF